MPVFDFTITLGTVMAAVSIVAGVWTAAYRLYALLDKRLASSEHILTMHAQSLVSHASRMEKQDDMMMTLSGDIHRMMGRLDVRTDRRGDSRPDRRDDDPQDAAR